MHHPNEAKIEAFLLILSVFVCSFFDQVRFSKSLRQQFLSQLLTDGSGWGIEWVHNMRINSDLQGEAFALWSDIFRYGPWLSLLLWA